MKQLLALMMVVAMTASAAEISIIPQPNSLEKGSGVFKFNEKTTVIANGKGAKEVAEYLREQLSVSTGLPLKSARKAKSNCIVLIVQKAPGDNKLGDEGYTFESTKDRIVIMASRPAGLFYGVQTLRQLLPAENFSRKLSSVKKWPVPAVKITDKPRFVWRGMHLDVCRHFFNKEFVMKYLDVMASHKMNTFHWHLTEDQGWRIEIKEYPLLTEIGAWREKPGFGFPTEDSDKDCFNEKGEYGGYYTQDDIKEVLAHAKKLHITVVPEIEMPGHSKAALKAYPELACTDGPFEIPLSGGVYHDVYCAGNEKTMQFLEDVLNEVADLFPGEFVHVGGDECPKSRWEKCPKCQKRIKDEGLHSEHELQSYVIKRASKVLAKKGKRLIGWNEIMEGGLAEGAAIMSWTGEGPGIKAAGMGHDVVMSPGHYCYFDHYQALKDEPRCFGDYLPLERVYSYNPMPKDLKTAEEQKHIIGAQGNMWSECYENRRKAEYMLEPRAAALSEVLWSKQSQRDYESFSKRMLQQFARFYAMDMNYRPPSIAISEDVRGVAVLTSEPKIGDYYYTLDDSDPTKSSAVFKKPVKVEGRKIMKARMYMPGGKPGTVARVMIGMPKVEKFDTSLPGKNIEYVFDGFMESYFHAGRNMKAGDHVTMILEKAEKFKRIDIITGSKKYGGDWVRKGVVEVSADGKVFKEVAVFDEKINPSHGAHHATAELTEPVKAVRLRILKDQPNWVVIPEIILE